MHMFFSCSHKHGRPRAHPLRSKCAEKLLKGRTQPSWNSHTNSRVPLLPKSSFQDGSYCSPPKDTTHTLTQAHRPAFVTDTARKETPSTRPVMCNRVTTRVFQRTPLTPSIFRPAGPTCQPVRRLRVRIPECLDREQTRYVREVLPPATQLQYLVLSESGRF